MHIKPFRATYPKLDRIPSNDLFCSEAKNAFPDYLRQGWLTETGEDALYIIQIEDAHRRHTGLIALNHVRDFLAGKVKKHEKTLSEREQHQMQLFLRWGAILKPVLLTYPPVPEINAWLQDFTQHNAPLFEMYFPNDDQTHRVWMAPGVADWHYLQELFTRHVPGVYIADGHHRISTLALLHKQLKKEHANLDFDHLFCAFFSTDQLDIQDYNRVVDGLNGLRPKAFLTKIAALFDIEPIENPRKPRKKYELKMLFREQWYRLHWKPEVLSAAAANHPVLLDVNLLNELVLHRLLGIGDIRTDERILYIEGSKGLKGIRKTVRAGHDRVGFALHPVSFSDMMRIADAGESLPPKSTFFAPRLKSGLLVKMLEK
jgi:uncharacterized protein (DUF1015 family)